MVFLDFILFFKIFSLIMEHYLGLSDFSLLRMNRSRGHMEHSSQITSKKRDGSTY